MGPIEFAIFCVILLFCYSKYKSSASTFLLSRREQIIEPVRKIIIDKENSKDLKIKSLMLFHEFGNVSTRFRSLIRYKYGKRIVTSFKNDIEKNKFINIIGMLYSGDRREDTPEGKETVYRASHTHAEGVASTPAPYTHENGPTIILISSAQSMLSTLRTALGDKGYRIEEYKNGAMALEASRKKLPDLALIDVDSDIDCVITSKELRKLYPHGEDLPILILTSQKDEKTIDKIFAVEANDFIVKPVNFRVLQDRVALLLDESRAVKLNAVPDQRRRFVYTNSVTGLLNFRAFQEKLIAKMKEPHHESDMIAVMVIHINWLNLTHEDLSNRDIENLLHNLVAKRIQEIFGFVANLGGDDFATLLDHATSMEIISVIADKLCQYLAEPFKLQEQEIYISTNIGISIYPMDSDNPNMLIKYAIVSGSMAMDNSFFIFNSKNNHFPETEKLKA